MEPGRITEIVSEDLRNAITQFRDDTETVEPSQIVNLEQTQNPDQLLTQLAGKAIIENFGEQQNQDREFRNTYAKILIRTLVGQIIAVNIIVVCIGFRWLVFDGWIINLFIVSVFGEIAGMAFIIVNYLFPKNRDTTDLMKGMQKDRR